MKLITLKMIPLINKSEFEKSLKDYQTINNFELKNKFKNYKYLKLFLRYYLEKNDDIRTSMIKFLYKLTKEFNEININYNLIPKDEEIKIINTFKNGKK